MYVYESIFVYMCIYVYFNPLIYTYKGADILMCDVLNPEETDKTFLLLYAYMYVYIYMFMYINI
jgi:hypothetical protein